MKNNIITVSNKSNSKLSATVDAISVFLLVIFSLNCLITSFELNVKSGVLIFCTALFTSVFTVVSVYAEKNSKYAICNGVIFAVFILVASVSYKTLASELNYVINTVLKEYSVFLNLPRSVAFAANAKQATAIFVVISALLCGLLTFFLIRLKFIFPAAAVSIIVIIPCFILVNTLPDLLPLLGLFAVLFTLFISSAIHRINANHSPAIISIIAVFMAVLVAVVYFLNPLEGYERSQWQDNLLELTRKTLSMENHEENKKNDLSKTKNIEQEVDLSKLGPLEKTNQKVMTIDTDAPYVGRIYLRGVAYTNYENNKWSLLTDEQAQNYPANHESFTMTITQDVPKSTMNITTERDEDVIFTPYFLSEVPTSGTALFDVFINNDDKAQNYDVDFKAYTPHLIPVINPYITTDEHDFTPYITPYDDIYYDYYSYDNALSYYSESYYFFPKTTEALAYKDFVYQNYLSVPENVRSEMIDLALENGFLYQDRQDIIDDVKHFVASSASYSLDTQRVPQGKDLALWLLNESDTGYCVHFATATTLMLRSMGIPARYVSGYCVEAKSDSVKTIVTSDNAHAWVEYFDDNIGWVPLEATPPSFTVPEYSAPVDTTQPQNSETQSIESTTEAQSATYSADNTASQSDTTQPDNLTPTQPTTQADDKTATPPTANPDDKITAQPLITLNAVSLTVIIISALGLAVLTVILRRKIILLSRQKNFANGSPNKRAKQIYKYLLKLAEFSHIPIPEEIVDIADKAHFSGRQITKDELDIMTQFSQSRTNAMAEDSPIIKKIYLKYILVLI